MEIMEDNNFGKEIYSLMETLFPIMRSITGNGNRETLKIIKEFLPELEVREVPSGTKVFDWEVPLEWNCRDAWIKNSIGEKVIDLKNSNLHVVNYSTPLHQKLSFDELTPHLYFLPNRPEDIPYITSYYKKRWGFCLSQKDFKNLKEGEYEVFIDSDLNEGNLTFGEIFIKGESEKEILLSSYLCHPSQCNDSLSGVALLTFLTKYLLNQKNKFSYRILFIPETIGAITWLKLNEENLKKLVGGYVLTCVGDKGNYTYKRSRTQNHFIDKIAEEVLENSGEEFKIREFDPSDGSDERQFSSPGFNIAMGSLMKTKYGEFEEYHTSADNLSFVDSLALGDSFSKYVEILKKIEVNFNEFGDVLEREDCSQEGVYLNQNPKCEPQLGKRGLYDTKGGRTGMELDEAAIFWILNFSDGKNSLLDISSRSGISYGKILHATKLLESKGLLKKLR